MKKKLIVVLVVLALIFVAACGKTESGNSGGESGNAGGSAETNDDVYSTPESGMQIPASKAYAENEDKVYLYYSGGEADDGLYYMEFYLYPASLEALDKMNADDFTKAEESAVNLLNVFRALDSKWTKDSLEDWCNQMIGMEPGTLQVFGTETGKEEGDYTIYYSLAKEIPDTIPAELKPVYESVLADMEAAKDELLLFDPLTIDDAISGQVLDFETTDFEGNAVSSKDIFAKNKYTMVNIWASWCGPCIQELPELEEINKEFEAKGCGIVGLLTDGTDPSGLSDAKEIIADAGVTYLNVIDSTGIANMLGITGVPTSVFVDSNGQIVGKSIVGANPEAYRTVMDGLLGE